MKKFTLAALMAATAITLSSAAFAANQGGYNGPINNVMTVETIQGLNDDTYVILQGNITQALGDEMYVFSDGSGTINVEIDDDDWNGLNVGPQDLVVIKGQIDRNGNLVEVDVDEVMLAAPSAQ